MSVLQTKYPDIQSAPTTLEEMQSMSYEDFRRVEKYLFDTHKENTVQERIEKNTRTINKTEVFEHLIKLANKELSWQGEENTNSLRDFWYNPVKPIVERAFPEDDTNTLNNDLSDKFSDLVKEGEITYKGMNILDESRDRTLFSGSVESDKILFVEKDSAFRKVEPLAEVYKINIISGSGFTSLACSEDLSRKLDTSIQYDIFTLTDYDPTGFEISQSFKNHMELFGFDIRRHERVAINPNQLSDKQIQTQAYTPPSKKKNQRIWLEEYGIDGKYGLELEAIGNLESKGRDLRRLVVQTLRPHIREDKRIQKDVKKSKDGLAEGVANSIVQDLVNDLVVEIQDEAHNVIEENNISVEPYSPDRLHDAAVEGGYFPTPDKKEAANLVKNELEKKIYTGEISVDELLNDLN